MIKKNVVTLKTLELAVQQLPEKITCCMDNKTQDFLRSCAEVTTFDEIKNQLLTLYDDFIELCQGTGTIIIMLELPLLDQINHRTNKKS